MCVHIRYRTRLAHQTEHEVDMLHVLWLEHAIVSCGLLYTGETKDVQFSLHGLNQVINVLKK